MSAQCNGMSAGSFIAARTLVTRLKLFYTERNMEQYVCLSCCKTAICVWCLCVHDTVVLQGELKLTVLISWESGKGVIHSHVAALPQRPQPPVKVQVSHSQTGNHGNKLYSNCFHGLQSQTRLGILVMKLCTPSAQTGRDTASVALIAYTQRALLTAACILLMPSAGVDAILSCCYDRCCQNRLSPATCMHAAKSAWLLLVYSISCDS